MIIVFHVGTLLVIVAGMLIVGSLGFIFAEGFFALGRAAHDLGDFYSDRMPSFARFALVCSISGVPLLLKDLLTGYAGMRTTNGSRYFEDFVAPVDSAIATRINEGGFIRLAKTVTPEFGYNIASEPEIFPPARNPWNPQHTPGGSSGGSSAAVAARKKPRPLLHASSQAVAIRDAPPPLARTCAFFSRRLALPDGRCSMAASGRS